MTGNASIEITSNERNQTCDKSRDCCCQAQNACLHPAGPVSLPRSASYKRFNFETSTPGLPRYYLYHKACTKYFPVLLSTTKGAENTSQYTSVPHNFHKVLPGTTLYYKACTEYFPVLLCQRKSESLTSM